MLRYSELRYGGRGTYTEFWFRNIL